MAQLKTSQIRDLAITTAKLGNSAVNNQKVAAAAGIEYSKLTLTNAIVNGDVATGAAVAYSKLDLASSIVNADIATGAAIAYSKLSLADSIVNADVATGAAIAYSKLNLTGSIVDGDLSAGELHLKADTTVLQNKNAAFWDQVSTFNASGSSDDVTTEVEAAASTDTPRADYASGKGIVETGDPASNYRVVIRRNDNQDPIDDGSGSEVYGLLNEAAGTWTLSYKKGDGTAYTFSSALDVDFIFQEIYDLNSAPAQVFAGYPGWVDDAGVTGNHTHTVSEISDLTSTQSEIDQVCDGVSANVTAANLSTLTGGGVTGLHQHNLADGAADVTATAAEVNQVCDGVGVTVTTANLDEITDGSTTALHQHALADGANDVTATAGEVNTTCDGNTATAAEITQVCDGVGVTVTAANLDEVTDGSTTSLHQHNLAEGATDITSTQSEIDQVCDGVSVNVTSANLSTLTGGGVTGLHQHNLADGAADVSATAAEVNQVCDGVGVTVTTANLDTLTDGSNADALHTHGSIDVFNRDEFLSPGAAQTDFVLTTDAGAAANILFFLNGVLQDTGEVASYTPGTKTVVLTTGVETTDDVVFVYFS
jgi:hypothetical protein